MKIKYILIQCVMLTLIIIPDTVIAKTWGLGAVIGAPTGLSANYFLNLSQSVHSTLAYDFSGDDELQLASHYTWRRNNLKTEKLNFGWFYGVGAKLAYHERDHNHRHHDHDEDDHFHFGPSGTLGVFREFKDVPLEIFLKSNLTVNIIEHTGVDGDLMLGLHYNF